MQGLTGVPERRSERCDTSHDGVVSTGYNDSPACSFYGVSREESLQEWSLAATNWEVGLGFGSIRVQVNLDSLFCENS